MIPVLYKATTNNAIVNKMSRDIWFTYSNVALNTSMYSLFLSLEK